MTRLPSTGITKDAHDAHVEATQRPYTQGPMKRRIDKTDSPAEAVSLLDIYLKGEAWE